MAILIAAGVKRASAQAAPAIATGRQQAIRCATPPPFARRNYFFSAAERSFYEILRRLNPGYTVFAKVRLCDLVRVQASGREFWEKFNSISSKHVDFVVCDEQLAPLLAIELDDYRTAGPSGSRAIVSSIRCLRAPHCQFFMCAQSAGMSSRKSSSFSHPTCR